MADNDPKSSKYLPSGYLTQPWYRWSIEIDGLPIKHGDFPQQTVKLPEGNADLMAFTRPGKHTKSY